MTPARRLRRSSSVADRLGQAPAHRRHAVRVAAGGLDRRGRVVDRDPGDPPRLGAARTGRRVAAVEAAHVEVVDDLVDEVVDVLDERARRGSTSPAIAEPAEHLLAEAVRRGDRRRVEVGERAREPRRAALDLVGRAVGEQADDLVASAPGAGQRAPSACSTPTSRSRTRSRSSPVAIRVNVTSSRSLQRDALGDVARGERGDRVRLAGAGARLEHGHAGRAAGRRRRTAARRVAAVTPPSAPRARAGRPTAGGRSGRSASSRRRPSRARLVGAAPARPSSSSNGTTPPSTSWCSGSLSSLSKL